MDVLSRVEALIAQKQLLTPGEKVLVAVSGGADSLCLLDCLHRLEFDLVVAHLDHQLRPSSASEAEVVRRLAVQYGLPVTLGQGEVRAKSEQGYSMEDAARDVRYRFLADKAQQYLIESIATGHTQDDQVETILMHFLRGAGSAGLQGMQARLPMEKIFPIPEAEGRFLVRPMLGVTHAEAMQYCIERGLNPLQDESNLDERFLRNRIRHRLLPTLEGYNPNIRHAMLRMAEILRGEHALIRNLAGQAFSEVLLSSEPGLVRLDRDGLRMRERGLQREVLRIAIRKVAKTTMDVDFQAIERGLDFSFKPASGGWVALNKDLRLIRTATSIILLSDKTNEAHRNFPQLYDSVPINLSGLDSVSLGDAWRLAAVHKTLDGRLDLEYCDHWHVAIDMDKLTGSIVLRRPKEGERMQPFGMAGSTKISDIFINAKVPRAAREKWPVLADEKHVLWVVGLKYSRNACLTADSKHILLLDCDPFREAEG